MKIINYTLLFYLLLTTITVQGQLPATGSNKSAYAAFKKGEQKLYKGNLINGERVFGRSAKRYEQSGDVDGYIAAKAMEAILLLKQDRPKAAFQAFKYAEELFDAQKVHNKVTKAYLNLCLGQYHLSYNESKEAEKFLTVARKIMKKNPSDMSPVFEVELYQSMGELYVQTDKKQDALSFFKDVLRSAEKVDALFSSEGEESMVSPLVDKAMEDIDAVYKEQGETDKAIEFYKEILANSDTSTMSTSRKSKLEFKAGENAFKFTDYDLAYEQLMNALNGNLSLKDEAKTKSMLATIAMSLRDYKDALQNNGDALRIQTEIGSPTFTLFQSFVKQGEICQKIEGANNSAYWYKKTLNSVEKDWSVQNELDKYKIKGIRHVGDPTLNTTFNIALLNFKRAELLISKLPENQQLQAKVELYMAKGNLYFDAGQNNNALIYYEQTKNILKENYPSKCNLLSETYRYLAAISAKRKNLVTANDLVNKAIDATLKKNVFLNINSLPNIDDVFFPYEMLYALVLKSAIVHRINSKNATEANMKEPLVFTDYGLNLITKLKKIHRHESAKYELSELTEDINHQAISTTRVLYRLSPKRDYLAMVFNYMEQSKSSLLLQAVQQLRAQKIINVPSYVIEKEQKLKTKISYYTSELYYERQLGEKADLERIEVLQKKLKGVKKEYPDYLDYIEKTHPKYFALKYQTRIANLDELQQDLTAQETFVNYILTDSLIHILLITPEYIQYTTTQKPFNLNRITAKYISSLKGENPAVFLRYSSLFYQKLIDPIKEKIMGKDLIIIPDGVLNYIPFEVLPTGDVPQYWEKGDYDLYKEIPYLLKSSTVVYNYSATLFLASRKRQKEINANGFVGYAPDFNEIESFTLSQKHQKKKYEDLLLDPLENAALEVAMIGGLTKGKTWIGKTATETAFKNDAANYGIVHFATHGILNNKFPLYSNLVLLGDDKEDGLLHTFELYNMEINAELVALSACNTGVGKMQKGEGAMSIARGFAYAGCPNIAMTLWPVSDQATQILMEKFYSNIMMGMRKAEALRKAKLHFIESGSGLITVPYFWAGMLIVGTPDEIQSLDVLPFYERYPILFWGSLLTVSLLLLGGILIIIKRKK